MRTKETLTAFMRVKPSMLTTIDELAEHYELKNGLLPSRAWVVEGLVDKALLKIKTDRKKKRKSKA